MLRLLAQAKQHLYFFLEKAAHCCGHVLRRADDRRVRTVRRAERVVHVAIDSLPVGSRYQLRYKLIAVAGLAWVETEVLQQLDIRCQFAESSPYWAHRVLRIRLGPSISEGTAEVARTHDLRASLGQPFDGWQCGPDPEVVSDRHCSVVGVRERNVEIGADENALGRQAAKLLLKILEPGDVTHDDASVSVGV